MVGYTTFTYGGLTLNALSVTEGIQPKTIKQTIGKRFIELGPKVASQQVDQILRISGNLSNAVTKDTDRTALKNLYDGQKHVYSDGVHTGNFAIKSLSFLPDEGGRDVLYSYQMELVEW